MALPASGELGGNKVTQANYKIKIEDLRDEVAIKANESGDATKTFKVADATNDYEAVSKAQLDAQSANIGVKLATDGLSIVKSDESVIKNQCTAYVVFDGTDGSIKAHFNVASVYRSEEGLYVINFATDMDNTNYGMAAAGTRMGTTDSSGVICMRSDSDLKVDNVAVEAHNQVGTRQDQSHIAIAFFGGKN